MNVLHDLLRIKDFRENQAELRVHRQYGLTQQAHEKHEAEQTRLAQMLREGMETEHRLYGELCERVVRLHDIEAVQHTVASLRQREALQRDAVATAFAGAQEADQALAEARSSHQEAHRQKTKFVDLSRDFDIALAREAERREDLEMEEAASVQHDREDWNAHDPGEPQK
ncbi:type III secretion system stalk subunit SctO [Ottowia sp. VDI28]|uniref:type III secretion system stalk subunit SctO n=1 Tax=Ottowia sp. VDI28 TaxID=3133968 RepID=UPI003C2DD93F